MTVLFSLLALPMTSGRGEGALVPALAGIWLGAVVIGVGYFQLRRSKNLGNLDFLKAFFGGLILRFAVLVLAGLVVHFATGWDIIIFMVSLALTYPLFLAFEAWRVSGEQSPKRESPEGLS
jgi:hypothetical protein